MKPWAQPATFLVGTFRPVAGLYTTADLYLHIAILVLVLWLVRPASSLSSARIHGLHARLGLLLATTTCLAASASPWLFIFQCVTVVNCFVESVRDSVPLMAAWGAWYVSLAAGSRARHNPTDAGLQTSSPAAMRRNDVVAIGLVLVSAVFQLIFWVVRLQILEEPPSDFIERTVYANLSAEIWLVPALLCSAAAFGSQIWGLARFLRSK